MIKSYKKFSNKKLNKEELDLMTSSEISDYRINLITKAQDFNELKPYLFELEVYEEVRFKPEKYETFDRWCKKAHENEKNGIEDKALAFSVKMLEKENGYDLMYYMGLISDLKKVDNFEYIKGIEIDIPEKYKDMFKLNI